MVLAVAFLVCLDISAELAFWCITKIEITFSMSFGLVLERRRIAQESAGSEAESKSVGASADSVLI